jgi:hypothetical protein
MMRVVHEPVLFPYHEQKHSRRPSPFHRYHVHLNRQEWLVVTQAFEDGLKVAGARMAAAAPW